MGDDWKFGCAVFGGIAAAFALVVAGVLWLESVSCHQRFADSGLQSDWGVFSGCRVNVPEQGWIPAENYRVL